ncbi:iron-containing alcohol dehydrogenase [Microbacterium sufflavum]|uniref:Iron-containing alcohol dehydrogenase n=2 Tax=Microbacteriaceae TaxID=85023 RepID=A0ABY4IAC1_9MICO|nr:iron-containing alcohol dehydrogenase [Microbacterium sufflavum]
MTSGFAGRVPTLWHGPGIARRMTRQLTAGREALVIADPAAVLPLPTGRSVRTRTLDTGRADVRAVLAIAREMMDRPPEVVVAVGGGSILDAGKIAALALARGHLLDYAIGHARLSALTVLPDALPPVDLVAVPTTLGTSSETNGVGILTNERGSRLIVGRALRPRHALVDPWNFSTLSPGAVREGALEAFLRIAGAATSVQRSPRADSDAVALGRALLETAAHDAGSPSGRQRLARLSGATQRSAALRGGDPFSARHWYLANEVSSHLGVRKMVATAAVIGAVWRRIGAGDARWGDRESLADFWARVAHAVALPLDPADGIDALLERWRIPSPPRPAAALLHSIAEAAEQSWGGRRPMLHGLDAGDLRAVLGDGRWSLRNAAAKAGRSTKEGGERDGTTQ